MRLEISNPVLKIYRDTFVENFIFLSWDFPGSLVVKTSCFYCSGGTGSIPDQGTKILHAVQSKNKDTI